MFPTHILIRDNKKDEWNLVPQSVGTLPSHRSSMGWKWCGAVQCGVAERIRDLLHGKMDKAEAALTLTLPSKDRYSS